MTAVANWKNIGSDFSNEQQIVRVLYDFAVDGGATGVLNLLTAEGALIVKDFHAVVKTACTSGGSMVLDVGIVTTDTDRLCDGIAVATLVANYTFEAPYVEGTPNTRVLPFHLPDNGVLAMEIKTADLTAGKIEFVFTIMKA